MQECTFCGKAYDELEFRACPYCSRALEDETKEKVFKYCPNCSGIMYWCNNWECTNCGHKVDTDIYDSDGIICG